MVQTSRKKRPLDREIPHLRDTRLIVIATEGRETEKSYFNLFRSRRVQVKVLPTGEDNCSSPKHVLERLQSFKEEHDLLANDTLWLMVDVDRWKERNLSEVAKRAYQQEFKLAISNPCFEVWLLCHFQSPPSNVKKCKEIEIILCKVLNGSYNKSRLKTDIFANKIPKAIQIAKECDQTPNARWPTAVGTHVYKVAEEIQALERAYF